MLLEAVGPVLESVSWLWAVFHLGLSRNLLFKVFATIWSPGEVLQSGIVRQALISVSGQGVMPYLGVARAPLASGKGARGVGWNMEPGERYYT